MENEGTVGVTDQRVGLKSVWTDFKLLVKFRLSTIVVFSAVLGYFFAIDGSFSWLSLGMLALGGYLVTFASNTLNQVIEKDLDKLMTRTMERPIARGAMSPGMGWLLAGIMGVLGVAVLGYFFSTLAATLGAISLFSYAFIYTPLKRYSSFAVFVGAFPGALPTIIGFVAAFGSESLAPVHWTAALLIFAIQFMWQFPHFWAIAWVSHDDYQKAGFSLLPSKGGKNKASAMQAVLYTVVLIVVSLLPYFMGFCGIIYAVIAFLAGIVFLWQAMELHRKCDDKSAKQLMFGSFLYLPIVLLALVFDKV